LNAIQITKTVPDRPTIEGSNRVSAICERLRSHTSASPDWHQSYGTRKGKGNRETPPTLNPSKSPERRSMTEIPNTATAIAAAAATTERGRGVRGFED
jgi:hypothetical protein